MANILKREYQDLIDNTSFYLERWKNDPLAFVMEACRAREFSVPVPWQVDALYDLRDFKKIARGAGHGVGKSRWLGWAMWWVMVTQKGRDGTNLKIPCTGPSGGNIEDVLWSEVNGVFKQMHPFLQEMFVVNKEKAFAIGYEDEWFARLRTSRKENPEAMQGFHGEPSFFIIDEAVGVPDEVFDLIRGTMTGDKSYGAMFANPRRLTGYFYRAFHSKKKIWNTGTISCADNLSNTVYSYPFWNAKGQLEKIEVRGLVHPDYLDSMAEEYGLESPTYKFRVLGEFPSSESDSLIRRGWIDDALVRGREQVEGNETDRVMGVDVAYVGDDWSAIVVRNGRTVEQIVKWYGNDPTESAIRVMGVFNDFKSQGKPVKKIMVDDIGVGAGVTSTLRQGKYPVYPVTVSSTAPEDGGTRCRRMRDWLWWQCRLFFQHKSPILRELSDNSLEGMVEEMLAVNYSYDKATGKLVVDGKDDIKSRLKRSPDVADALCLTFFSDYSMTRDPAKTTALQVKYDRDHRRKRKKPSGSRWKLV